MNPVCVEISLQENDFEFHAELEESIQVIGGDVPTYDGDYSVAPKIDAQILETKERVMKSDLTVMAIPFSSVRNPQGGETINIAFS